MTGSISDVTGGARQVQGDHKQQPWDPTVVHGLYQYNFQALVSAHDSCYSHSQPVMGHQSSAATSVLCSHRFF